MYLSYSQVFIRFIHGHSRRAPLLQRSPLFKRTWIGEGAKYLAAQSVSGNEIEVPDFVTGRFLKIIRGRCAPSPSSSSGCAPFSSSSHPPSYDLDHSYFSSPSSCDVVVARALFTQLMQFLPSFCCSPRHRTTFYVSFIFPIVYSVSSWT